jgi:hypothetical protein
MTSRQTLKFALAQYMHDKTNLDAKTFELRCAEWMDGNILSGSAWHVEVSRMEASFTYSRFIHEVRNYTIRQYFLGER